MANVKISNLEQINIYNPDDSFVMVVAQSEENGPYRNYRISLNQLRTIIGSIEGDIVTGVTEEQVRSIVNAAILEDNTNELNQLSVQKMIDDSIASIDIPTAGLSEAEVNTLIQNALVSDNANELTQSQVIQLIKQNTPSQHITETRVNELINEAIVADNLKDTVAEVVPDVIPSVIPDAEIQLGTPDDQVVLTVKEVAEKVVVQENSVTEITKEIKEGCVCEDHADDCFNTIFS